MNEETKKYCEKLENEIWRKFQDIRSESTLQLRNQLHAVGNVHNCKKNIWKMTRYMTVVQEFDIIEVFYATVESDTLLK